MNQPARNNKYSFSSVDQAFAYLEQFANFEKRSAELGEYRLDRMAALLDICGNPQNSFPAIHIAGSKGKGSTAHFCGAILEKAGYKVGMYASPHLVDYRERICCPQGFFADDTYLAAISQVRDIVERIAVQAEWKYGEPTTFELLTLSAYLIFQIEAVDWMVIETGLGGRLDATNLMHPRACLITALELEHTEILGNTIEEIAREKSGIFRENALLLTQSQSPVALAELKLAAQRLRTPLLEAVAINPVSGNSNNYEFTFWLPQHCSALKLSVWVSVAGAFQAHNVEIAARCLVLLWDSGELSKLDSIESLVQAIQDAVSAVHIKGRLELYQRMWGKQKQVIVLDVAHTPQSVRNASDFFRPTPHDILLFGCVSGKLYQEMAAIFAPDFGKILVSTPGTFKKSDPVQVYQAFLAHTQHCFMELDPRLAFQAVLDWLEAHPSGRGLICGSFYMAGAIVPLLLRAGFQSDTGQSKTGATKGT